MPSSTSLLSAAPRAALALVAVVLLGAWQASGAEPVSAAPGDEAERLRAELKAKMDEINAQQQELAKQLEQVESRRQDLELILNRVEHLEEYRAGQAANSTPPPPVVGEERKAEIDAQREQPPALPRVSAEIGGVLTPKGRLIVEPFFQYLYASTNRLNVNGLVLESALLVGIIDVSEADRDSWIGGATLRYGITRRLEAELRLPYVIRDDIIRTRRGGESTITDQTFEGDASDFGDVEFDLRYQLPRPSPEWPFLVANVRTRMPTGTDPFEIQADWEANGGGNEPPDELATGSGFWSFNPSLTFMYPTDPVVFFGNLGYLYTLEDDKPGNFGDVDPGDAVRLNFGMGFGLNDRASFSLSYSLDKFSKTELELLKDNIFTRSKVDGSDVTVGRYLLGFSLKTPGGQALNLAIGIGATEDAADTDLTFRMPFTVMD